MPPPTLPRAAFDAVLARAGIRLSEAQAAEIYAAYGTLEMLCERVRQPLPPEAEPATIVRAERP